jgi:hypothetical protein
MPKDEYSSDSPVSDSEEHEEDYRPGTAFFSSHESGSLCLEARGGIDVG